jgi:hypothetical protein
MRKLQAAACGLLLTIASLCWPGGGPAGTPAGAPDEAPDMGPPRQSEGGDTTDAGEVFGASAPEDEKLEAARRAVAAAEAAGTRGVTVPERATVAPLTPEEADRLKAALLRALEPQVMEARPGTALGPIEIEASAGGDVEVTR